MKLTLAQPQYLKDSISIISDLVTEARFNINAEGLTLIAMDPANVAMVVFKLLSSSFVEYNLTKDVDVALNLNNLKQVLRRVGSGDTVTIELEDESRLRIVVTGKSTRRFSLPIIELDEREQKVPNLQFPYSVTMSAANLNDAVEDAMVVADSLSMIGDKDKLTISAQGDLSKVEVEMNKDDSTKIEAENDEPVKSKYSVEYLKKMVGGAKLSDNVKIQFSQNYPLKMEFVEQDKLQLSFVLAPRVESD